jgi:hypothetical protein
MANSFANLPAPAGNGSGAGVDVSTFGKLKTVTVQDAFRGSVNIEVSLDAGTTWAQVATFTNTGKKRVDVAAGQMRVTRSGVPVINPGLPNVDVASDDIGAQFAALPATAGDGEGSSVDVSALGTFNTVTVLGTFRGTVNIQISEDGTDWATCMTFTGPGIQSKSFVAQFMRVQRTGVPTNSPGLPVVNVGAINDATAGGGAVADISWNVRFVSSTETAAIGDLMACDPSGGAFAINLPAISPDNAGKVIRIKNVTDSTNAITLTPTGGDTVDDAATFDVAVARGSVDLVSDGVSDWLVV